LDLEKPYDAAFKHGILKNIKDTVLKDPIFIYSFRDDRNFKVRFGSTAVKKFSVQYAAKSIIK
jgi:tRNA(His) 5'-end guanylyltransferase